MKKYTSITGYLERFSLFGLGKLKIRWHKILSADGTPYCHNHPFHYVSIIIKGQYTEEIIKCDRLIEKTHKIGSIIIRSAKTHHRIKEAKNCRTLFFAWDSPNKWSLKAHKDIICPSFNKPSISSIYRRKINGKELYCKFDEFWFIGSEKIEEAKNETRLSIYQVEPWIA